MLAATYKGNNEIKIEDVKIPEISDTEALLKVKIAAICGTDLRILSKGHFKIPENSKRILGHEVVGEIVEVGKNVKFLKPGTRVGISPNVGCGKCKYCLAGSTNLCPDYKAIGITYDGGFAEYMKIPEEFILQGNIVSFPSSLSYENAIFAEPFSAVINGQESCRIGCDDIVLIIGAGPMGIMHFMLIENSGIQKILVSEVSKERREQISSFGAKIVIDPLNEDIEKIVKEASYGRGADVIIIAAPSAKAQEESLGLVSSGGRINFFGGLPEKDEIIKINSNIIHYKQIILTGTTGQTVLHFKKSMEMLISKKIKVNNLVGKIFNLKEAEKAFKEALSKKSLKILLKP